MKKSAFPAREKTVPHCLAFFVFAFLVLHTSFLRAQSLPAWGGPGKVLFAALTRSGAHGAISKSTDGGKTGAEPFIKGNDGGNIYGEGAHAYFNALAYGDGLFVATGTRGYTVYSTDGKEWKRSR